MVWDVREIPGQPAVPPLPAPTWLGSSRGTAAVSYHLLTQRYTAARKQTDNQPQAALPKLRPMKVTETGVDDALATGGGRWIGSSRHETQS